MPMLTAIPSHIQTLPASVLATFGAIRIASLPGMIQPSGIMLVLVRSLSLVSALQQRLLPVPVQLVLHARLVRVVQPLRPRGAIRRWRMQDSPSHRQSLR